MISPNKGFSEPRRYSGTLGNGRGGINHGDFDENGSVLELTPRETNCIRVAKIATTEKCWVVGNDIVGSNAIRKLWKVLPRSARL